MTDDPIKKELALLQERILWEQESKTGTPQKKTEFHITKKEEAEWLVGKLTALDAKEEILERQYNAMKREIENDRRFFEWRFGRELQEWVSRNLPPKKKSIKLLTGTVGFRTRPPRLEVVDENVALEWAKQHAPDVVEIITTERILRVPLKEHFEKAGEVPPGCALSAEEERFFVKGGK